MTGGPAAPGAAAPPAAAPIVATSLKTYLDHERTMRWAEALVQRCGAIAESGAVAITVFPSFPSIPALVDLVAGTGIAVGAQNVSEFVGGAHTGEVTAQTLRQVGARAVEIGHAERRARFGETDAVAAAKIARAREQGLSPTLCIGETSLDPSTAIAQCVAQLEAALAGDPIDAPLVIGYEPVWAIGREAPAPDAHVAEVAAGIAAWLDRERPTAPVPVIYGGSAGRGVYTGLAGAVDGVFVGRFGHDPAAFADIVAEALEIGPRPRLTPGAGAGSGR